MPRTPTPPPLLSGPHVVDLATPFYIAHRNALDTYPEASLEGAIGCMTNRQSILEWDNYYTVDGTLFVMHDPTIDRTTNGTGNSVDVTKQALASLVLDTANWFGTSKFGNLKVPTCEEMLRAGAGRAVMFPEAKNDAAGAAITALVVRMGLQLSVVVQGGSFTALAPVVAAGIDALLLSASGSATIASLNSNGVEWVGCDSTLVSTATVDAYVAAGIKVALYTLDRKVDRDAWLGHGVSAFFSDTPVYLSGADIRLKSDPFALQTWFYGMPRGSAGSRGLFKSPDRWGINFTVASKLFVYMGWMTDAVPATTYTFRISPTFDVIPGGDTTSWAGVFFCAADDREYKDAGASDENGYTAIIRASGQMQIFKRVNGALTTLGTSSGGSDTPISSGETVALDLTVTPTQITLKRVVTGQTLTVTDNTHRGGHRHLGGSASTGGFQMSFKVPSCPRP